MRRALVILAVASGCQPPPSPTTGSSSAPPPMISALSTVAVTAPTPPPEAPSDASGPSVVVESGEKVDIDLYAAYLVDERGELGTMSLWPDPYDCPDYQPKQHIVPAGGSYALPAPTRAYDSGRCAPGPTLPSGRYILRIHTGYGEELFGVAAIDLPLTAPVRIRIADHSEEAFLCDESKARRAARLAFAAASKAAGFSPALLAGCRVEEARCGSLPLPEAPPPEVCTVGLFGKVLRVDRPAGDDAPRGLTAWVDRAVVYAQRPELTRTSASRVELGGKLIVLEGDTDHHRHAHGGEAAKIGYMTVRVHSRLDREVGYAIEGVDWLVDHGCAPPHEIRAQPAVLSPRAGKLPPGKSELHISFESHGAYMAHCDRFASRVRLRIEGEAVRVTAEHKVTRFEPLRR